MIANLIKTKTNAFILIFGQFLPKTDIICLKLITLSKFFNEFDHIKQIFVFLV